MARIKRGRGRYFAQVPHEIQDDPKIDSGMIAAYAALRRYADWGGEGGGKASHRTLAQKAGMGVRTLIDRLEKLRDTGWIEWDSGKTEGTPNTYIVHAELAVSTPEGMQEAQTGVSGSRTPGERDTPTPFVIDQEPITENQLPPAFDAAPYVDLWIEAYGGKPPGSFFPVMKELEAEHGPDQLTKHLRNFLEETEARFVNAGTPRKFLTTFGSWAEAGGNGKARPTRSTAGVVKFDD